MQTILIADSHKLCREALCDYIRHAGNNITIYTTGHYKELQEMVRDVPPPDLVIIDEDLAGMEENGHDLDRLQIADSSKIALIVTNAYDRARLPSLVVGAFPKTLSCKAFMAGIQDMLAGQMFFPEFVPLTEYPYGISNKKHTQELALTAREREVLTYLVKGASNKDIARALDLQVVTVKLHVR
ncbi:MAG: hypothetical protein DI551_01420, partial [Micavibrio aeruginosavorus]